MRSIGWNPHSLAGDRALMISRHFQNHEILILPGTQRMTLTPAEIEELPFHNAIDFGFPPGARGANKSVGVTIMLKKNFQQGLH